MCLVNAYHAYLFKWTLRTDCKFLTFIVCVPKHASFYFNCISLGYYEYVNDYISAENRVEKTKHVLIFQMEKKSK